MSTTECSWRLWPSPPMYEETSYPLTRRTRATLRIAEFGFFGVVAYTRVHTPRFCGDAPSAGTFVFSLLTRRGFAINWLVVAMLAPVRYPCGRRKPGRLMGRPGI